jgi:hypothetical protein
VIKTKYFISFFLVCWLLLPIGLTASGNWIDQGSQMNTQLPQEISPKSGIPTYIYAPQIIQVIQKQTIQNSTAFTNGCSIGTGLKDQTFNILSMYKKYGGLIITSSSEVAETYFPELGGLIRSLGGPSLEALQTKAERARNNALPYEVLAYGLETGKSTPDEEWNNLIESTSKAADIANEYNKLLAMGPGFRLMSENEDKYAPMAAMADIWILQTQQLQRYPPGPSYRDEVQRIVNLIHSGNPNIQIWGQITFPPDQNPDIEEWLAYHQLISGQVVDGTYIGVFTWDTVPHDILIAAIESIFTTVCGNPDNNQIYLPTVIS